MENYYRWQLLMRDITSPQSYIDFGFYFLIGAALQRRVWMGNENPNQPGQLFTNHNTILVGEPGVGKGRVIGPVNDMLKFWRFDIQSGKILEPNDNNEGDYDNFLFCCGPENTTFEQLLDKISKSYRRVDWEHCINPIKQTANPIKPDLMPAIYGHSSVYFALEELSSLLQKDTNKITDFFLQTYDCNDYRRETKTQGITQLKKPCVSLLAGTTPGFMEDTFKERLLTDGMSARCWFIYEFSNRKNLWGVKPYDNDQLKARYELIQWLKKLALLYGRVTLSSDADECLKKWWEEEHPVYRPNNNMKLAPYYARKNIHVMKLCMILHFSEQFDDFTISLETARRALKIFEEAEQKMHYALNFGNRNPFHTISRRVLQFMLQVKRPMTKSQILEEFHSDVRDVELQEILRFMQDTDKIIWKDGMYFPKAFLNSALKLTRSEMEQLRQTGTLGKPTQGHDLPAIPLDKPVQEAASSQDFIEGENYDEPT